MQTDLVDREAALRERLDAPRPTTWRPDDPSSGHGNLIIGELAAVENGHTDWGARQIAILKDAEGVLWNVWLMHKVLIDEFLRKQPRIGEMLAIRYEGKHQPEKGGSAYEKYTLVIDRADGPITWASPQSVGAPTRTEPVAPPTPPAAPAAEVAADPTECGTCGFRGGKHATGCSNDIPF